MALHHVLVVDDSAMMRQMTISVLKGLQDLRVSEAANGADALKLLSGNKINLLIADINMPVMDGMKLLRHVRQDQAQKELPVIILTTETAEEDRRLCLHLGADAYLTKPLAAQELLKQVQSLLKLQ